MTDPDFMTFAEFKEMVFQIGNIAPEGSLMSRFYYFIKSGCTEAEAKRWLALHIWDFEPRERETLTMALAAEALYSAAKQAEQADASADPPRNVRER